MICFDLFLRGYRGVKMTYWYCFGFDLKKNNIEGPDWMEGNNERVL
jgi:hypothetical protein